MVGRLIASQIASASILSFLPRLTYGLMYCGGISITSCPKSRSTRAQWCEAPHASSPIRVDPSLAKEFLHLAASDLPSQYRLLVLVNSMKLKDMFGRVQPDPANRHLDGSFGCVDQPHSLAHSMP
jgi:hypothetical protein